MSDMVSTQDCAIYDEVTKQSASVGLKNSKGIIYSENFPMFWHGDTSTYKQAICDPEGRLIVNLGGRPAGAADFRQYWQGTVTKNNEQFQSWLITNGKEIKIDRFGGGTFSSNAKVELYVGSGAFPGAGWTFISVIYLSAENSEITIALSYLGNGTKRIGLRFVNNIPTDNEMFGYIVGYEL
jgi:hypothetical protein